MIPGLYIAQHAGGGKAEQIFMRGFDADHGTDVGIYVDGMPVIVSRGTGTWGPRMRLWCPGEILRIVLRKKE